MTRSFDLASAVPGYFADPALAIFDGRYYLYPTSDGVTDWDGSSFSVLSSEDLIEWTDHGVILELGRDVPWARGRAWAPAIARRDDQYFFYFTADMSIGVAVGDSPVGPFSDLGRPLVPSGAFPGIAIDPSVFVDDDGAAYLYWGNSILHGVELAPDMVSFDPGAVRSWTPTGFREAGWVHRRGALYYLSWSENDTREEDYRVRYAISSTPLGPWRDGGVLIEKDLDHGIKATGHHSIVNVPGTDEWIVAYHRFAIPNGDGFHRETVFDHLRHADNGDLMQVIPSRSPLYAPLPGSSDRSV